jgi:hypothetical protein
MELGVVAHRQVSVRGELTAGPRQAVKSGKEYHGHPMASLIADLVR